MICLKYLSCVAYLRLDLNILCPRLQKLRMQRVSTASAVMSLETRFRGLIFTANGADEH